MQFEKLRLRIMGTLDSHDFPLPVMGGIPHVRRRPVELQRSRVFLGRFCGPVKRIEIKRNAMAKKKAAKSPAETLGFEQSLKEVEQIVGQLESGELGLTDSLENYERGIGHLKQCHALLDAAEQRVSVLSGFDADGNPVTEPAGGTKKKPPRSKKGGDSPLSGDQGGTEVDDLPGLF